MGLSSCEVDILGPSSIRNLWFCGFRWQQRNTSLTRMNHGRMRRTPVSAASKTPQLSSLPCYVMPRLDKPNTSYLHHKAQTPHFSRRLFFTPRDLPEILHKVSIPTLMGASTVRPGKRYFPASELHGIVIQAGLNVSSACAPLTVGSTKLIPGYSLIAGQTRP